MNNINKGFNKKKYFKMFNFKNKYDPNPSSYSRRAIPGLSKFWRYSTLDAQNNNNIINNNIPSYNNNSYNYSNQVSVTSPDDITLEISYDNFYTLGVDMMKKKKYAEELKKQIEEKQMRKKLEKQKKKLDDLNEEIRLEKERKIIEDKQRENNKRNLPKINFSPYNSHPSIQEPMKLYTPPPVMPIISQHKTPRNPKINNDLIRNFTDDIPRVKYVYRKVYNNKETNNFLRKREESLEKFDRDMKDQLQMLKDDFNLGMKRLNDEVDNLNNGLGDKAHNFKYLIMQKMNEISSEIKNNNNHQSNIPTEHIYSVIRKSKDGKTRIERFLNNPDYIKPFDVGESNVINDKHMYDELIDNNVNLPYLNLSHCISYC